MVVVVLTLIHRCNAVRGHRTCSNNSTRVGNYLRRKSVLGFSYDRYHCFGYLIATKAEGMFPLCSTRARFTVTAKEVHPSMIRIRGHHRSRRAQTQKEARTQTSFDGCPMWGLVRHKHPKKIQKLKYLAKKKKKTVEGSARAH